MHIKRHGKGSSVILMKLTFTSLPLSPRSIWLLCLLLINLPLFLSALSPSISLHLPDHFTLLSTSPLPSGLYLTCFLAATFSVFFSFFSPLIFSYSLPFWHMEHFIHLFSHLSIFFSVHLSIHTFLLRVVRTWKGWICFFSRSQATASESRTQDTTESFFICRRNDEDTAKWEWIKTWEILFSRVAKRVFQR